MITRDILDKINALVSMLDPKEYDKIRDMIDSIIDDITKLYANYYKIKNDNVAMHEEKILAERKIQIPQNSRDEYEDDICYDEKDYDNDSDILENSNTFNNNLDTDYSYNIDKNDGKNEDDIKINYYVDRDEDKELCKYMIHNVNVGMNLTNLEKVKYAIKFILEDYIYNLDIDIYKNFRLTELVIGKKTTVYMCEFAYHLENDEKDYTLHDYYEFMQKRDTVTLTNPNSLLGFKDITCKIIEKDNYNYEFKIYHKEAEE